MKNEFEIEIGFRFLISISISNCEIGISDLKNPITEFKPNSHNSKSENLISVSNSELLILKILNSIDKSKFFDFAHSYVMDRNSLQCNREEFSLYYPFLKFYHSLAKKRTFFL